MKRHLNTKLLAVLMGLVILMGSGIHALHAVQVKRSAKVLLQEAGYAEKQGDVVKAAEYLERYLRLVPNDPDALAQLAVLLASDALARSRPARVRALAVADKALIHAPGRRDVRRKAVDLALGLSDYDIARSHGTILLESTPEDGALEYLLGLCEEGRGQFEKAAGWYERAVKHSPKQIDGYVRLAGLLRRRLNRVERADQVMDANEVKEGLIAANGQSFRAYLARAKYRKSYGIAGADSDVARALGLAPDEADVLLVAAESALDRADLESARRHLDQGINRHPGDVRMYQGRAALGLRAGWFNDAVACLERGVKALPTETGLLWTLAEVLAQRGRAAEAGDVLRRLRVAGYPEDLLGYLDARLAMRAERWSEAKMNLEKVRLYLVKRSDLDALKKQTELLLATCYRQIGNVDLQYEAGRRAAAISLPDDRLVIPAHLEIASALVAMRQIDGAIEEYARVLALSGALPHIKLELARLLILKNLSLPAARRRWQDAEQFLGEAEPALPESAATIATARAEILAAQGQLDPARALLEKARGQHSERVELWTTLALLTNRQGRPEEGLSLLEEAQRRLGDRCEIRLARAQIWKQRGGPEAALALAKLEQGTEALARADRRRLLAGLANIHQQSGDSAAVRRLWTELVAEQPDNLGPRYALLDLALQDGDTSAIDRHLQELRKIEGEDGTLWRFGQVRRAIQRARAHPGEQQPIANAQLLLMTIAARRPTWSDLARARAEIDDLLGNPDLALKNYLRAIDLGDRSWLALRRAIEMLMEHGRVEQADQVMREFQDQTVLSPELQRLAASIALQTQDFQRALELARRAVRPGTNDFHEQVWLGQVLWISARSAEADRQKAEAENRRAEAEAAFRRAVALAGEESEPWVALVGFLGATGQFAAADRAMRQAEATLPKERAPLALAQCSAALGRVDCAESLYRDAINGAPDDVATRRAVANFYLNLGRFPEAEPHLRQLIALRSRTPAEADWARRILARLRAMQGGQAGSLEAMELLGLSTSGEASPPRDHGASASLDERRAQVQVLAVQPIRSRRREAIHILEEIARRDALTSDDLFLLGHLYEADGDWPKSRELLQRLMTTDRKHPRYPEFLASYARSLIRRGEADQARIWLARLEEMAPGSAVATEIKARLLVARRRGDEAAALVTAFAEEMESHVAPAATLLEELGQVEAAEVLYRRSADLAAHAEGVLTLATFLARQGRLPEALDIGERAWQSCPPGRVGQATIVMLFTAKPDEAQIRRVEGWLVAAIHKDPSAITLQFDLANLKILEGRYTDAEAIYRKMSERYQESSAPLNNLAWLIAIRGGKTAEAVECINKAITLQGAAPNLLDTRGLVSLALGRSQDAIKDLEDALAVTQSPLMYMHLAQAHLMAGDRTAASEALQTAKAAGLRADTLNPLERAVYARLNGDLNPR